MSNFQCPHCGGEIFADVVVKGNEQSKPLSASERADLWLKQAPREVRTFIEDMEASGVMASFREIVAGRTPSAIPHNLPKFVTNVASRLQPYQLPVGVMDRIREHFGPTVSLWQANGYVAVVQDRTLAAFTSVETIKELRPAMARFDFTDSWVKTRFGYVVTPVLFDEFRRRAIGAWDRVTGSAA